MAEDSETAYDASPSFLVISGNGSLPSGKFRAHSKELQLAITAEAIEILSTEQKNPLNFIARDYPDIFIDIMADILVTKKSPYLNELAIKHGAFVQENTSREVNNLTLKNSAVVPSQQVPGNLVQLENYRAKNQERFKEVAIEWAARTELNKYAPEQINDEDVQAHIKHIELNTAAIKTAIKGVHEYICDCLRRYEVRPHDATALGSTFSTKYLQELAERAANDKGTEI